MIEIVLMKGLNKFVQNDNKWENIKFVEFLFITESYKEIY